MTTHIRLSINIVYHAHMSTIKGTYQEGTAKASPPKRAAEREVTFLTDRLDYLFETVHPKGRKPYSYQEVADGINAAAGENSISPSYLWQLHTGKKANPTRRHIALIAAFFGVSPLYFFEGEQDLGVEEIELARILQDPKVHALARAAAGLSDKSLDAIAALIKSLHTIESEPRGKKPTTE